MIPYFGAEVKGQNEFFFIFFPCKINHLRDLINKSVQELVEEIIKIWPGKWEKPLQDSTFHEANLLHLQIEKAQQMLDWLPKWDFEKTIKYTVDWYKAFNNGEDPYDLILKNIIEYELE